MWKPKYFWSPQSFVYAFHALYISLPGTLNYTYHLFDIPYVLPWGQFVYWENMSAISTLHILSSYSFLACFCYFSDKFNSRFLPQISRAKVAEHLSKIIYERRRAILFYSIGSGLLSLTTILMIASPAKWMANYSYTFLVERNGFGEILILGKAVTDVAIFSLGFFFYKNRSPKTIVFAIILIILNGFLNGFKSRIIILTILFFFPFVLQIRFNFLNLFKCFLFFLVALYTLTIVRSNGFYAGLYFVEMLMGYFNAFPLHDMFVVDNTTFDNVTLFGGLLRWLPLNAELALYDLSVELTKIYYPEQWYKYSATQQWPLITELYVNFGAPFFWIIPLTMYFGFIAFLFWYSFYKPSPFILLIVFMEGFRIISTLRGVLIPWTIVFTIITYTVYFILLKKITFGSKNARTFK